MLPHSVAGAAGVTDKSIAHNAGTGTRAAGNGIGIIGATSGGGGCLAAHCAQGGGAQVDQHR